MRIGKPGYIPQLPLHGCLLVFAIFHFFLASSCHIVLYSKMRIDSNISDGFCPTLNLKYLTLLLKLCTIAEPSYIWITHSILDVNL